MKVNSKSMLTPALACALVAGAVAAGAQPTAAQAPAPAEVARPLNVAGANLLTNPGHEHPGAYFGGRGEINVTWNWTGYWEEPPAGVDPRDQYYRTPEFRPPFARDYPERVKSGGGSDRWFNYYALNKKAGIMQYVADLPVGAPIRFTSHLQVWSTNDDFPNPAKADVNEGNLQVRVCIDQDGGPRDMSDPNLVCSEWAKPNNKWVQLSVDGVAKNSVANAIIWSTADIPVQHNDIYADESCFEILPAAGAEGVCKGAGFLPTGAGVAPLPADVGSIKVTAEQQAQLAKGQPAANTATATTARVTAPAGDDPALAVNARVSLNLRETPANNGKVAGNAKRGAVLPVLAKSKDGRWYQVELNGKQGWVLGSLTLPNAAAKAVAVVP
jgi:uncharacterized protein YgiM (DUF1202 family)